MRAQFCRGSLIFRLAIVGLLAPGLFACGLNTGHHYGAFRPKLLDRDFDGASQFIEQRKEGFYGKKNRLLFYMDKASVLNMGGRYKESNVFLEQAKTAIEDLYTESVGEHAAALLTTDNALSYQGEDFEKVLVHYIAALNYLGLRDFPAARVEARQVGQKLELYNSRYDEDQQSVYKDDAFARWLAGKLAATQGTYSGHNDAWIDLKKAITVYRQDYKRYGTSLPQFLVQDAMRTLDALGNDFAEERSELESEFPGVSFTTAAEAKKLGQVVFLHNAGEAPHKIDKFWTATEGKDVIRIAYPEFVIKSAVIVGSRIHINGKTVASQMAEDINAIALQNLADHMVRIKVKAIARAVAKFIAGKAVQNAGKKEGNAGLQVLGQVWNLGQAAFERADKRSWVTLPAQVRVAQLFVEPGPVTVEVDFLDRDGHVVARESLSGTAKPGKTLFLSHRTFR